MNCGGSSGGTQQGGGGGINHNNKPPGWTDPGSDTGDQFGGGTPTSHRSTGCGFLGLRCAAHFGYDLAVHGFAETIKNVALGTVKMSLQPVGDLLSCTVGSGTGCINFLLDITMVRPITEALLGAISLTGTIYHEFTNGHPGAAIGSILAIAGIIAATRRFAPDIPDAAPTPGEPPAGPGGSTLPGRTGDLAASPKNQVQEGLEKATERGETVQNLNDISATGGHGLDRLIQYVDASGNAPGPTWPGAQIPQGPTAYPGQPLPVLGGFEQALPALAMIPAIVKLAWARWVG